MSAPARYPLAWPAGWPRTGCRKGVPFQVSFGKALAELDREIAAMGGRYAVLSTNLGVRLDGSLVLNKGEPIDRGVAVYFAMEGKQKVFACDTYNTVTGNVRAIGLTIANLRAIARYGASHMLERALSAFEALPAPLDPWQILGIPQSGSVSIIEAAFRALALKHHPDKGGSAAKMAELNRARELALEAARKTG